MTYNQNAFYVFYVHKKHFYCYVLANRFTSLKLNALKKLLRQVAIYFVSQYLAALFVVYKTFVAFGKQSVI